MLLDFATVFFKNKDTRAKIIIHAVTLEASAVAFVGATIPGDRVVLGALQAAMVVRLGKLYNVRLDKSTALSLIKSILATYAGPIIADEGIKYIPGYGWAVHAGVAGTLTEMIGWTSVKMFKDGSWFKNSQGNIDKITVT